MRLMKSKLKLSLMICAFVFTIGISFNAQAEYYLVYPGSALYVGCEEGCRPACYSPCYQTPIHHIYSVSPKRHYHTGSGEMQEYEWISVP